MRANARVLGEAHELEAKRRRAGLVCDEDALAAFFAGKIPDDIHTAAALDAWYQKATPQQQAAFAARFGARNAIWIATQGAEDQVLRARQVVARGPRSESSGGTRLDPLSLAIAVARTVLREVP